MIAEDVELKEGETVLREGEPAKALFFLLQGGVDLYFAVDNGSSQQGRKEVLVCEINTGEPFGISALIEPHILTATVRSSRPSRVIQFDTKALYKLLEQDQKLENILLRQMARIAFERLHATRVLLAAAWA